MNLLDFLVYLAIGRLCTWMLQTAGLLQPLWRLHRLLTELAECDLCLGFWVYLTLAVWMPPGFGLWPVWIERLILAAVAAFMAHLLRLGWESKFGTVVYD